jgi:hypothetical protein
MEYVICDCGRAARVHDSWGALTLAVRYGHVFVQYRLRSSLAAQC